MIRPLLAASAILLLAGCARPGGLADTREGCAAQASSFIGAGDSFVRPTQGRADLSRQRGGDTNLQATLARENSDLDSLQIAFDSLLYCRWIEARTVRADLTAGRVPRAESEARMAALRARLRADLARARAVLAELERQAATRVAALEQEAPGVTATAPRGRGANQPRPVVAAATVLLRLRPEGGAPEVGRVAAGESVSVRPAAGGFAAVESGGQIRGYAPAGAFQIAERTARPAERAASPIRTLAATNIARRENFAESVSLAESSAVSGFELAT
ncbi:hypothetical protein [Plastoroseomonas arctica]|uniref:SH3b domain-containing protein n=1 Tax=Plastoroseomonas arctica TaxID=1509237 RepID=A0AAF1JXK7_9PROT|nr:hypothetical protein [Plastoroseomonas arctica]MBR0655817.1 hypothetical protein [Plastoroseomonas arctica]